MGWKTTLKKIFDAIAEPYREYGKRYRSYNQDSHDQNQWNDYELIKGMDREGYVSLGDIKDILGRLRDRAEFRFSDDDFQKYLAPFLRKLEHDVVQGYIDGHLTPLEEAGDSARIKVGDVLDCLAEYEKDKGFLPDGLNPHGPVARETVYVAVDPEIDGSTVLGKFQKRVQETMPLRTPTIDVTVEERETDRLLNVRRPLIMAIGYAAMERDQRPAIESMEIPTYSMSTVERQKMQSARAREPRYYRGIRMD